MPLGLTTALALKVTFPVVICDDDPQHDHPEQKVVLALALLIGQVVESECKRLHFLLLDAFKARPVRAFPAAGKGMQTERSASAQRAATSEKELHPSAFGRG